MKYSISAAIRFTVVLLIALGLAFPTQRNVLAAAPLTITPITWNVIGLDSNNVNVGPNNFPIGARVCNPAGNPNLTDISSTFVWDSSDTYINLRPGSQTSYSNISIPAGQCKDLYYEIQVTRATASYDNTRRYHITASSSTLGLGTVSTVTPREIYVEHLVSQNRNSVNDVQLSTDCSTYNSVSVGGTMTLLVGNTYCIKLIGSTSTNGYEQLESFINFPNTTFKVNSVATTFSANGGTDPDAGNKLYADGCTWVNDPTSPNYRSCIGTGKYGGSVTITYNVTIIGGGGGTEVLNTLLYDFSGSSYHYNSDFSSSLRYASIIDPTAVSFSKAFSPASTVAGGTSTLTFTISNPTTTTVSGVNFTDPLPTNMKVASPATYSTSNCGSPTFAPAANDTTLTFSNGTLAPSGSCIINVVVTVPATPTSGTYTNTTNHLFINALDTGKTATANLTLTTGSTGTGVCGTQTLATWAMDTTQGTTVPPLYWTKSASVATALATSGNGLTSLIDTAAANGNPANSWSGNTGLNQATAAPDTSPYFQFQIDTSNFTNVNISLDYSRTSDWNATNNRIVVYSSTTGLNGSFTEIGRNTVSISPAWTTSTFNAATTGTGSTYFRITGIQANNNSAKMYIDNIIFQGTGCITPTSPTLTKAFAPNPIAVNATSVLTFTLSNPNSLALTGAAFTDALPTGLEVAASPSAATTCGGTWAPSAGSTTLTFTGGTVPANGTCTVTVSIKATTSGPHTNVSGFISTTESGTNSTATGSATASLTALQAPSISKLFNPNPILAGTTTTLTFTITNPNQNDSLTSVAFSDTFPATPGSMVVAATPNATTSGCGSPTFSPTAGAGSITFTNATIAAGGSCRVTVDVTAPTAGDYINTSSSVSTVISGVTVTGNTASNTLTVKAPNPAISLSKQISTSSTGPWSPFITIAPGTDVYYRFTIENTGDVALSPVSVNDPTVNTSACTWPGSLPVASPVQDPTATCVVGPITALTGDNPNTATARGQYGGTTYSSTPSTADYVGAVPGFSLQKLVGTSANGPWASAISGVAPGSDVYYKFTVVNTGGLPLSGITITDSISAVNTLAAGCVFTDPLPVGGATNCTVGPVTASATAGIFTNTATASGTNTGVTYTTPSASADYIVTNNPPDLSVTKAHTPAGPIQVSTAFTWDLTLSNTGQGDATFIDGQVILSDPLPAGPTYGTITASNFTNITNSGNINCAIANSTLTCSASGGNVTLGATTGSFNVTIAATTPATAGTVLNTATIDPRGLVAETNENNNSGNDSVSVLTAGASISLAKSIFSGNPYSAEGDPLVYEYLVNNTGGTSLAGPVTVSDDKTTVTCPNLTTIGNANATFDPGESITCTATYNVILADMNTGSVTNTATASAGATTSNIDSQTATATQTPRLTLTKDGTLDMTVVPSTTVANVGDQINYTITVTNTGNVTITNLAVSDGLLGAGLTCPATTQLAPNAFITCTGTYTLTQTEIDAGSIDNTASASAKDPNNNDVTASATKTVTIPPAPALTLTKTPTLDPTLVAPNSRADTGDEIVFTFTVQNTGNVTITNITVTDPSLPGLSCTLTSLAPGASTACTASNNTHTLTQSDIDFGSYTNTASVTGKDPGNNDVTDSDTRTLSLTADPALTIVKSVFETSYASVGTVLHYSYLVTNSGNVTLSGPFTVTDDMSADETCPATTSLAPGANLTCTATYTTIQNDLNTGSVTNIASAHGFHGATSIDSATDTQTVNAAQNPALTLTKTPTLDMAVVNPAGIVNAGDTITYGFSVQNTGNVTITSITVTDPLLPTLICTIASLNPGATATCSASNNIYSLLQSDINAGSRANTASATGKDPGNNDVTDTDTRTVNLTQIPGLTIDKSAAQTSFTNIGDILNYSYLVTNSGNVTLTGPFTITDDKSTDEACPVTATLAPGTSITCTASFTITTTELNNGFITNVASAHGSFGGNQIDSATDSVTISTTSGIQVIKSANATIINSGGSVTYTYTVTNTGGAPLNTITVSDDKCNSVTYQGGDTNTNNLLENTETWLYQCSTTLTSTTVNTATVTGKDPSNTTVQDTATLTVVVLSNGINKTILSTSESFTTGNNVAIGELVTYRVVIDLPAGLSFSNVVVTDQLDKGLAFVDCVSIFVAGADITGSTCPPAVSSVTDPGDSPSNPANPGRQAVFMIGNIPAPIADSTLVLEYQAVVLDVIENQANATLNNAVTFSWTGGGLTASAPPVTIVEPDLAIEKSASPTFILAGQNTTFTLSISHTSTSSADAFDVVVTDLIPSGLAYVPCSLTYTGTAPDANKRPVDPCNLGTTTLTFGWDTLPLGQTSTISFQATLTGMLTQVTNTASVAWTSLPIDRIGGAPVQLSPYNTKSTEREYDPADPAMIGHATDSIQVGMTESLPDSGFAPNQISRLPTQPLARMYTSTNVWLEIPRLGLKIDIAGVPYVNGQWDVTWLGNQAGWLNGTAFPSWQGNSVITGHVYLANGKPGPFIDLSKLKWNDKIIVHAYGSQYTYAIMENKITDPEDTSALRHEDKAWVTLITCKDFNPTTNTYNNRVVIRAVLVAIKAEK